MATATVTETRTDEEIQRDVLAELKRDAQVQPNKIGVAVKDGVVTLTGWVDSFIKQWTAKEAALRVRGVKAVATISRCICQAGPSARTPTLPQPSCVRWNGMPRSHGEDRRDRV